MSTIVEILHTARTLTRGGREHGASRSADGLLDIRLSPPGSQGIGTNPEQLFAAAWSASLESAIAVAARDRNIVLPADLAITAEVDLCRGDGGGFLRARLTISLPGLEPGVARFLLDEAQRRCPYSRATRRNIEVGISLN